MRNLQGVPHQYGVSGIDGDLIVRCVAAWQAQVEVLYFEVHIRQDQLRLDVIPAIGGNANEV